MGFFSSSKVYSVGTSATKLLQSNDDGLTNAILDSILNSKDTTNSILINKLTGHGSKVQRYYQYGRDNYVYGLPNGTGLNFAFNEASINDVLETFHPTGNPLDPFEVIDIDTSAVDYPIADKFARHYLTDTVGWDPITKIVTGHGIATPAVVYFNSANILPDTSSPQLQITYMYDEGAGNQFVTTTYNYYTPIDTTKIYYHVTYTHDTSPIVHWFYDESLGTYPGLDLSDSYVSATPFLPIGVLRANFSSINSDTGSTAYLTGKELFSKVGLDIDELTTNVMDLSTNPNANSVRDAFIIFGLGIHESSQASIEYFFEFFDELHNEHNNYTAATFQAFKDLVDKSNATIPANILNITDGNFNTQLTYNYTSSDIIVGVVGDVGTFSRVVGVASPYTYEEGGVNFSVEQSAITFNKQLTATTYQRVVVQGLTHFTNIDNRGIIKHTIGSSVSDDAGFYIPLSLQITNRLDREELEDVYYNALKLVIYAEESSYVSWYNSASFLRLVEVVIVAIAIYTGQAQLASIATAGSFAAGAALTLEFIAYAYLTQQAFGELVHLVGGDAALILAVIAAAAAVYSGNTDVALTGLPSAEQLMTLSSLLVRGIDVDTQNQIEDLTEEREEYIVKAEELFAEIQELNKNLTSPNISTNTVLGYNNNIAGGYNTPYSEYVRTINTNPGVLTLSMIESFVDDRLRLKLPDHTNGV